MHRQVHPGVLQIRHGPVSSYLLCAGGGAALIDTGFAGGVERIRRALASASLGWRDVRAILLTHGHLDHTLNAAALRRLTGAPLLAHRDEAAHLRGAWPYCGPSRLCGFLEAAGRAAFGFEAPQVDAWFGDGEELPLAGGLRVIHLPGHTCGHCGFFSRATGVLFAGDSHRNVEGGTRAPWAWLNTDQRAVRESLTRLARETPSGLLANHCDRADAARQLARFRAAFVRT